MNDHAQILIVSRDRMPLQTRKLILGTYFEVESAGRMSEAGSILSQRAFDLIVLCDTLSNDERRQIADMVPASVPSPLCFRSWDQAIRVKSQPWDANWPAAAGRWNS
ncbi:MAG: hypothetical protein WCF17_18630 [Terracidiphilus sp.]